MSVEVTIRDVSTPKQAEVRDLNLGWAGRASQLLGIGLKAEVESVDDQRNVNFLIIGTFEDMPPDYQKVFSRMNEGASVEVFLRPLAQQGSHAPIVSLKSEASYNALPEEQWLRSRLQEVELIY